MSGRHAELQLTAEALAGGLPALLVAAERVASTVSQGVHGRRRIGQGETFWQFRPYYAGDAPNVIDWRQTAKSDRVFVRQMEWEAAQTVWLWHDTSPSMDWQSDEAVPSKAWRTKLLLLALSVLLLQAGERVALIGGAGKAHERSIGTGAPGGPWSPPINRAAPICRHWPPCRVTRAPFSSVIFWRPSKTSNGASGILPNRASVVISYRCWIRRRRSLPYSGRVRFEGLEGEEPWLLSRVERVREDYMYPPAAPAGRATRPGPGL